MFWNDNKKDDLPKQSDKVVDASIKISCYQIPGDHIYLLYQALIKIAPWLKDDPLISVQQIFLPASGNGWERETRTLDNIIYLPKRSRIKIRIPFHYQDQIKQLSGQSIVINNEKLTFGQINFLPVTTAEVLVARFATIDGTGEDEELFLQKAYQEVSQQGISIKKMLCGKSVYLNFDGKHIHSRSLMLADLMPKDSLILQEQGVGDHYELGCGLFLPQKGIKAVNKE